VQGVFSLKYLVLFTKCTNLSSSVEIYLKNDYPLIVKFLVASLGELKLCLSPNVEQH
jgi:proliferating cell nuclear antigen